MVYSFNSIQKMIRMKIGAKICLTGIIVLPLEVEIFAQSRTQTLDFQGKYLVSGCNDFWRITQDPLKQNHVILVKTEHSVPVTRGAHSVVIAR